MSQFFISSKESRIENNRSFYGCFYLGPFEPSQSITIANTLRRTLLSEIYGLGIISAEIDGANHEYSSLPGVRDSVLDILLNLKEIVLKKTINNFKPQIGYLRVRGPGVVRASHLRLPPFIQLVDPNQYIATLAENGFLNMKFVIQYGNKWLSSTISSKLSQNGLGSNPKEFDNINSLKSTHQPKNLFNFHLKKRRLILKKLKNISFGTDSFLNKTQYLNMLTKSSVFLKKYSKKKQIPQKRLALQKLIIKKYPSLNLRTGILKKLSNTIQSESINLQPKKYKNYQSGLKKMVFSNSKPLSIDAIFNPINKVNYIIETNDFKESPSKLEASTDISELYEMLNTNSNLFIQSSTEEKLLSDLSPLNPDALNQNGDALLWTKGSEKLSTLNKISSEITQSEIESVLSLKREINMLKKETIKHNITLEIWTNGSIHPRDALYQSFKSVIKLFSNLKKINTFGVNHFESSSSELIPGFTRFESGVPFGQEEPKLKDKNKVEEKKQARLHFAINLDKKIKLGNLNGPILDDLIPLNEIAFLSTYTNPKIKNYYLNNQALNKIIKTPFLKSHETKHFISNGFKGQNEAVKHQKLLSNKAEKKQLYYKTDIGILNLSLRCYTILKRLEINTIQELDQLSKKDILNLSKDKNCRLDSFNLMEIESSLQIIRSFLK